MNILDRNFFKLTKSNWYAKWFLAQTGVEPVQQEKEQKNVLKEQKIVLHLYHSANLVT